MSLIAGVVSGPLLALVTVIGGLFRPGYSALQHDVSSLALGEFGWVHSATFVITGVLTLAFALGALRPVFAPDSVWGPLLVGGWAMGLIVIGLFVTDPTTGYPPVLPVEAPATTVRGAVHDVAAAVAFIAVIAALVVFSGVFARQRQRAWMWYTRLTAAVTIVAIVVASYGSERTGGLGELDGLFQRVAGLSAITWITVLAASLLRSVSPS